MTKDKEKKEKLEKSKSPKKEIGGRDGPDPVRYGDWENNGKCVDF